MAFVVRVLPEVVDAGAEITLESDLGQSIVIRDQSGADIGKIETDELIVKAPVRPGPYQWQAVLGEVSTPVSFTVKPHTTNVVVWDVPSAVVAGEKFYIKVGIKCSSECGLANKDFAIADENGKQAAGGTLSGDQWPGTNLYSAQVELEPPAEEGLYTWSVKCAGSDIEMPHDEGAGSFGIRVVSRPEFVLTVETIDKESQAPLSGARVVMHPYRAVTDERGVAQVRVAKGTYKLFVSETRYLTYGLPIEITADVTAKVELELEPVTERN